MPNCNESEILCQFKKMFVLYLNIYFLCGIFYTNMRNIKIKVFVIGKHFSRTLQLL